MKIDANDATLSAVRQMLGLNEKEPVTLELVLEHGAIGHLVDVEYVSGLIKGPLTLANVREYVSREMQEKAVLVSQAITSKEHGILSDDDIVDHVLVHCPHEVRNGWNIALEAHPQLSPIQILASVLIANMYNLHAGDTVLLTPSERLPSARSGARTAGFTPQTCGLARCGLPFIPKRTGAKYGCEACGNYAHREQAWAKRRDEAKQADQPFIVPRPELSQAHDGICRCGQEEMTQAV